MDGVAHHTAQDVFAKFGEELPHVLYLHDLAGHQEQDAHRSIPSHPETGYCYGPIFQPSPASEVQAKPR